jgi:hypothetical protein
MRFLLRSRQAPGSVTVQNRITACCLSGLLLFSVGASASRRYTENEVVKYAKTLDIEKLDPSLPSHHLDDWLRSGPPHLNSLKWRVSANCGRRAEQDEPKGRWPLCVQFFFRRGVVQGFGMVRVGTVGGGVAGLPQVEDITVSSWKEANDGASGRFFADGSSRLSDLPRLLDQIAYEAERPEVIAYAKSLDVARFDPTLSSQRLDEWFRLGPPRVEKLEWGITFGCELKVVRGREGELPLCVRVAFSRGKVSGRMLIRIGSVEKGVVGPLRVEDIVFEPRYEPGKVLNKGACALSRFPNLLDEVSSELGRITN